MNIVNGLAILVPKQLFDLQQHFGIDRPVGKVGKDAYAFTEVDGIEGQVPKSVPVLDFGNLRLFLPVPDHPAVLRGGIARAAMAPLPALFGGARLGGL